MAQFSEDHPRPWRNGSVYGEGARRPLNADARRIWRARVEIARRAGDITGDQLHVALALLRLLGPGGRLDPSHATLATLAGCRDRTVRRALQRLAELGFATWQRRIRRDGWRAVQDTNAYVLAFGDARPPPSCRPAPHLPRIGGQAGREAGNPVIQASQEEVAAARAALRARIAHCEAQRRAGAAARLRAVRAM